MLEFLIFAITGRLYGHDWPWVRYTTLLAGLVAFPDYILMAIISIGWFIGNLLRDSIFTLLRKQPDMEYSEAVRKMTLRAFAFVPLLAGVWYCSGAGWCPFSVLVVLSSVLSRAPVQFLCRFLPFPENSRNAQGWLGRLMLNRAAMYEFLWSGIIGLSIWGIIYG